MTSHDDWRQRHQHAACLLSCSSPAPYASNFGPRHSYRIAITILQNPSSHSLLSAPLIGPPRSGSHGIAVPLNDASTIHRNIKIYTTPPKPLEMPPKQDQLFLAPERPSHETKKPPSMTQTGHSIIVATASPSHLTPGSARAV
jgi:hypothetical protein